MTRVSFPPHNDDVQLEQIIQYLIRNNALIVEGLVGGIVILVLVLAYRSFLLAKHVEETGSLGGASLGDLEETLKKLLEKANAVPVAAAGMSAEQGALLTQIETLKNELEVKQVELEQAKAVAPLGASADPAAGAGLSAEEKNALDSQIKELQARLSEYEIISEDIADLSFYKEENAKLQKELAALKEGGSGGSAPTLTPAPAPTLKSEPEIVGRTRTPEPLAPTPPQPPPQPQAPVDEPVVPAAPSSPAGAAEESMVDDDIMKEFEAAVASQKAGTLAETKVQSKPTESPGEAVPVVPAGPSVDDLLAQTQAEMMAGLGVGSSNEGPVTEPVAAADVDLGSMDMDKMVAEAMGLDEQPAAEVNALETEMDPNKLALEAASLQDVKDEDVALMGDFENFVKKDKGGH